MGVGSWRKQVSVEIRRRIAQHWSVGGVLIDTVDAVRAGKLVAGPNSAVHHTKTAIKKPLSPFLLALLGSHVPGVCK
jgi:hypothetical protein